jgi:hypothetical protein
VLGQGRRKGAGEVSPDPFEVIRAEVAQLHRERPDRGGNVVAWAQRMQGIVRPSEDVAQLVRDLCVFFSASRETEQEWGQGLSDWQGSTFEHVRKLRAIQQELAAVLESLVRLHQVSTEDVAHVDMTVSAVIDRIELVHGENHEDTSSAQSGLETCLLSLMFAAGYGRGGGHAYSKRRAATLIRDAAQLYGFTLNVDSLCTRATTVERISKDDGKALQALLLNSRLRSLRSIEQSKAPEDEPDT